MRCFVAIDLPAPVKRRIADQVAAMRENGAREAFKFVPRENLHLTLRFLGNVEAEALTQIKADLAAACRDHGAIVLRVSGVGAFPKVEAPNVVWAGVTVLSGDLIALQARIEQVARGTGLTPEERPFAAHITFGRKRRVAKPGAMPTLLGKDWNTQFGEFTAERVTLFSSELGAGPPIYNVLEEFPLTCSP